ncbi:MAG: hypothetical protein GY862_15225 [Gammaproteobacteria bacterium]|nr:hypothetical protein [Gammaproteobacteria bacterium]
MKVFVSVGNDDIKLLELARELLGILDITEILDDIQMTKDDASAVSSFDMIDDCDMYLGIIPKSKEQEKESAKVIQQAGYCYGIGKPYCVLVEEEVEFISFTRSHDSYKRCATLARKDMSGEELISVLRYLKAFKKEEVERRRRLDEERHSHQRLRVDVVYGIEEADTAISVKYKIQSLTDDFDLLIYHNELSELIDAEAKKPIKYYFKLREQPVVEMAADGKGRKIYVDEEAIIENPLKLRIPVHFDPPLNKGEIAEFTLKMKLKNYRPYHREDLGDSKLSTYGELGSGCIGTWQIIEPTRELSICFDFPKGYKIENPSFHIYSNRGMMTQQAIEHKLNEPEEYFRTGSDPNRILLKISHPVMNYQYLVFYAPAV